MNSTIYAYCTRASDLLSLRSELYNHEPPYLVELIHLLLTDVEVGHLELVRSLESVAAADAQEVGRLAQLQQRAAQALLVLEPADVDGGCLLLSL
jgi:hypothetical protein